MKLNLTVEEAAKYSGIGEKNIRNLLKEKACPFLFMVVNKHLVKRHEFEKFIESKHYIRLMERLSYDTINSISESLYLYAQEAIWVKT